MNKVQVYVLMIDLTCDAGNGDAHRVRAKRRALRANSSDSSW